jgi:2-haloacid dehalogenase
MMSTTTVKALCFDVFGTVTDWRSSVIREGEALAEKIGVDVPWGEFVNKWRIDGYIASLIKIASGEMDYIATADIHKRKLLSLLEEYGINGLSDAEVDQFNLAWNRIEAWDDAIEGLGMMKQDFLIMPFSNGDYRCLLDIAKHNGMPWDGIISADFFKKVKPDLSIYSDAAEMLCMEPAEIMMVACHAQDLNAARKAGFRTAYVTRPLEYGPDMAAEEIAEPFDYHAADFVELARQLHGDRQAGNV